MDILTTLIPVPLWISLIIVALSSIAWSLCYIMAWKLENLKIKLDIKERHYKKEITEDAILMRDYAKAVRDYRKDNTQLINTNRVLKGANTKHKETIEGYKLWNAIQTWTIKDKDEKIEKLERDIILNEKYEYMTSNLIKKQHNKLEEAHIAINAVAVEESKKKRLAKADKFTFKD